MLLGRIASLVVVLVASLALVWRSALYISPVVREKLNVSGSSAKTQPYLSYLSQPKMVPHDEVHDKQSVSTSSAKGQTYFSELSRPTVVPQNEVKIFDGDSVDPHEPGLEITGSAERGRRFSAVTVKKLSSWGWGRDGVKASQFFNKARCKNLTVFFYPETVCKPSHLCLPVFNYFRHGDLLPTALHGESWRVTDRPQEACIFLLVAPSAKKEDQRNQFEAGSQALEKRSSFRAAGKPGMNHVYLSNGDRGVRWNKFDSMIQAWTSASRQGRSTKCYRYTEKDPQVHRIGFDVPFPNLPFSVAKPLVCKTSQNACATFEMKDRNTSKPRPLLSFWIGRKKTCPRVRSPVLRYMHDPSRKMIALEPSNHSPQGLATESKFLPTPTGEGRGSSYRLFEALSAGGVPIYIGETLEPPFSETLPFEDYAMYLVSNNNNVSDLYGYMKQKLKECNRNGVCEWARLQSNAIWVYEHYFASDVRAVAGLLELLGRRIRGHLEPVTPTGGFFKTAHGFCRKMTLLERELEKRGNIPPKGGFPVDREC